MDLSNTRKAAFAHVDSLVQRTGHVGISAIRKGFCYDGRSIPLVNPRKGIHNPRVMRNLLSIMTLIPRSVGLLQYDDQVAMLRDIVNGTDQLHYSFMGTDPEVFENQALLRAFEQEVPIIYFLGIQPGIIVHDPQHADVAYTATNGLLFCQLHASAFKTNLIGIDPQCRLYSHHLDDKGHATLRTLKSLHGKKLSLPNDLDKRPNQDLLRERFNIFTSMR